MSDLSSPRYNANGAYRPQIHSQRSKTEAYDVEDLKSDYSKALNHIETLKLEQTSLKNALRVALCEANSDYSKDLNSHRQSYHSTESFVNPKAMEKRLQELEQENRELKALLEANSKKIAKFQKEQKDYLEKVIENEKLHAKIDELNTELNTLNKEFCIITDKLLQVEVKNSDLLSQSIRYNQEPSSSTDRTSVLKYANYIYQLISSVDKNHFSFCCFEERFSKGQEFFNLIKSNDMSSLVLKAFKYITDLLINVNSQYFSNSVPNSAIHPTSPEKSIRYNNSQAGSQDPSYFTEYLPDQNFIQRSETPQNYDMSDFDDTPTPNIVSRLMERIGQRENERSGILKNDDTRSPLRNSGNKLHSLDSSLFGKFNSASKIEDKSMRSIENSPKKVQFKVNEDNKYGVETEILEYAGMEDSRPTSREDSRIEEESEQDEDLVARYKRELRERCKVKKEEKVENKPKQQKMGFKEIKEASYEEPEENSVNYSEPSKMHKEVSVLEVLSQSSSASKLKNFLKTTKDEKDSSVIDEKEYAGISQRKGAHHSRQNYSEASSNSESWRIDPKLRDYKVSNERANKNTLRAREKTTSLTRESSGSRFMPVLSPRMKSPKNNMTYQQINTARKTRATMEDDRSLKRQGKQNTSTSSDARKMEYVTYSVAFSKNEMKSKCSPSPSGRVMSVRDIPKKKRVDSYPKQTYDVIKGQELVKPKTK